jgi:hypothetical protein
MKELDNLIESTFSAKSTRLSKSQELLDVVYDLVEREMSTKSSADLGAAKDPSKISKISGDKSGQKLLDISAISRKLIRGTESTGKTRDVKESFGILRRTNPYIEGLTSKSPQQFPEALIEALNYYFSPPKDLLENPCLGLGAMMTRHIVLDAYLSIFQEYNAVSAGFVNENFISSLVGGQTVSIEGGHTSIADLQIGNGDYGISLKTASYSGKLSGSFAGLMRTLGIKYRTVRGSKAHRSDNDVPIHSKGLYYLLFNKMSNSHTITAFRVDREEIIKRMEYYSAGMDEDGYYVFRSPPDKYEKTRITGVLDIEYKDIPKNGSSGISNVATAKEDIKLVLPNISTADTENAERIIQTLVSLTDFYQILSNAILEFATNPDYEVLQKIKGDLEQASQLEPEKLISSQC